MSPRGAARRNGRRWSWRTDAGKSEHGTVDALSAITRVTEVAMSTTQEHSSWFREAFGYGRSGGRWVVTHQHSSVPFDMASGKASLGLEP